MTQPDYETLRAYLLRRRRELELDDRAFSARLARSGAREHPMGSLEWFKAVGVTVCTPWPVLMRIAGVSRSPSGRR